jgi:hypothetical protein
MLSGLMLSGLMLSGLTLPDRGLEQLATVRVTIRLLLNLRADYQRADE